MIEAVHKEEEKGEDLMHSTVAFILESNGIEGIRRVPTPEEISEHERFIALTNITLEDLQHFVRVYQPNAQLRDREGLNARVGDHVAPPGGPRVRKALLDICECANQGRHPYFVHLSYETLHPFTDGNGRSGRVLWLWQMKRHPERYVQPASFLHAFYYQALANCRIAQDELTLGSTNDQHP